MKNKFQSTLVKNYLKFIHNSETNVAINASRDLGNILWQNNLDIFSLPELEEHLIARFTTDSDQANYKLDSSISKNGGEYLFIATEIYSTGGHSRLLENLVSFLPEKSADLIYTQKIDVKASHKINLLFRSISSVDSNKTDDCNIIFLSRIISGFKNVFLLIHPYDINSVISCGLAKKLNPDQKIFFVNHSDHTFTFGETVSDFWFQISAHGRRIDFGRKLQCSTSYLGIPIQTSNYKNLVSKFKDGDLILSCGSYLKFKPTSNGSIIQLIESLLKTYKNSNVKIIGVRIFLDYWWWSLKFKYWKRLKLYSSLPHTDYINACKDAKLYIDSHPFPGGTAFAEQFFMGNKICTGLISRFNGYTPLERFKFENPTKVIDNLGEIDINEFNKMYSDLTEIHSFNNVKRRFLETIKGECHDFPSSLDELTNVTDVIKNKKVEKVSASVAIWDFNILITLINNSTFDSSLNYVIRKIILKCIKTFKLNSLLFSKS